MNRLGNRITCHYYHCTRCRGFGDLWRWRRAAPRGLSAELSLRVSALLGSARLRSSMTNQSWTEVVAKPRQSRRKRQNLNFLRLQIVSARWMSRVQLCCKKAHLVGTKGVDSTCTHGSPSTPMMVFHGGAGLSWLRTTTSQPSTGVVLSEPGMLPRPLRTVNRSS